MKYIRSKEDSLKLGLSLFLLTGSVAGTIFCNRMTAEMKQELIILSQSSVMQTMPEEINSLDLLVRTLPGRIWMLTIVMLAAATPIAHWCMCFAAGYAGLANAVLICVLTMEFGVKGLLRYILLIFPQGLCYMFAGYCVLWWMPAKEKRFTVPSVLFLVTLVCIGGLLESLINPRFFAWFEKIFL